MIRGCGSVGRLFASNTSGPFFGRVLFEQIGEVPDQVWDRGGRPGGGDGDDKDETTGQSIFQFYKIAEFY